MARINVDTELWNDPRFEQLRELTGSKYEAIGLLVSAWELGQNYWKRSKALVPEQIFNRLNRGSQLIDSGFASVRKEGVYLHGAQKRWDFLIQQSEKGKKSAAARKAKFGSSNPRENVNRGSQSSDSVKDPVVNDEGNGTVQKVDMGHFEDLYVNRGSQPVQPNVNNVNLIPLPLPLPKDLNTYVIRNSDKTAIEGKAASAAAYVQTVVPPLTTGSAVVSAMFPDLAKAWNENRGPLPSCRKLTEKRTRAWRERWKEEPSLEYWAAVIRLIAADKFCCGGPTGEGWRANVDYLLKPDTHIKVLERSEAPRGAAVASSARVDALFEE